MPITGFIVIDPPRYSAKTKGGGRSRAVTVSHKQSISEEEILACVGDTLSCPWQRFGGDPLEQILAEEAEDMPDREVAAYRTAKAIIKKATQCA